MWFPFQWQAIFRHIPCSDAQESVTYGWLDKPCVPFIYSHDISSDAVSMTIQTSLLQLCTVYKSVS